MRWRAQIRRALSGAALLWLLCGSARSEIRPQYGGVLRLEVRASSVNLNPRRWKPGSTDYATNQRLAELVFDRLVSLDNYGRFEPQLATEWSHDGAAKRWQFTLRQGVKFSDGTPCEPSDVVAALQPLLPSGVQIQAVAGGVVVQSANSASDLLEVLASGPYFILRSEKGLLGTGPFVLESPPAGVPSGTEKTSDGAANSSQRLRFRFNELCWSGRPFVNEVDVTLGVPPLRALLDLQLGKADLAELSEDTARRARQSNVRVWASAPLTLYAVEFAVPAKSESERTLREALASSLDRNAMAQVLLQRQAEAAPSFLPQWLSGYAFVFAMENSLQAAKGLPVSAVGAAQPLRLGLDASNDLAKLLAERVAVNARAAGLTLQLAAKTARSPIDLTAPKSANEAQLVVWRYTSLSPREDLELLASAWHWKIPETGMPGEAEARYAWEKQMMDGKDFLPLVTVPDFTALDARVRNWSPAPWGEWRLGDVWLDLHEPASGPRDAAAKSPAGARP